MPVHTHRSCQSLSSLLLFIPEPQLCQQAGSVRGFQTLGVVSLCLCESEASPRVATADAFWINIFKTNRKKKKRKSLKDEVYLKPSSLMHCLLFLTSWKLYPFLTFLAINFLKKKLFKSKCFPPVYSATRATRGLSKQRRSDRL